MKVAVFVSAGLGDALLLVPLVKQLRIQGDKVTGFFTSPFGCEQLFTGTGIFDEILITSDVSSSISNSLKNFRSFQTSYLNFFAGTRKNFFIAKSISKKITTNNQALAKLSSELNFVEPLKGIHDAAQNLRLLYPEISDSFLTEDMFRLHFPDLNKKIPEHLRFLKGKKYFAVQVSSGNNLQPFKNWKTEHWISFLKKASFDFKDHYFVLLGEPAEKAIADTIMVSGIERVCTAAGETTIAGAIELIRNSELFIGLDGGLMHIAVAAAKPTFTIWGGSDFDLYGYEKINSLKHKIIYQPLSCRPCNSWIFPNTTRVKKPMECPDYICMQNLSAAFAFSEFLAFYNKLFSV